MADKKVLIERVFDAPREKVWKAWTTPELVSKWWGPAGFSAPDVRIDFRVGGKYVYCMHGPVEEGGPELDLYSAGEFVEIDEPNKLVVTDYFSDKEGNKVDPAEYGMGEMPKEMHVTITFEDLGGKTKLTLDYEDLIPESQFDGMSAGWNSSLDKFTNALKEA